MQEKDPDHFQILEIAPDAELSTQSATADSVVEYALSVSWSDESVH